MKSIVFTMIISCFAVFARGQSDTVFVRYNVANPEETPNYQTDTLVFETQNTRKILYGTMALPWTSNQQFAKKYGLYLDSLSSAGCQQEISGASEPFSQ